MGYNETFRVFDNGGETVDRYTVFLADSPDEGCLGLSDDPEHPQGFSQFGDFDMDSVAEYSREIPFDKLPEKVQQHVLDRFGVTEDKTASTIIRNKIVERLQTIMEFKLGNLNFRGDDVLIGGKKVGEIHNDLDDPDHGIIFRGSDGNEAEFSTIKELIAHLMDVFRIKEGQVILEATAEQKAVVRALRKLAKKLEVPNPRFRSSPGRSQFIELSIKNWKEDSIPNSLRRTAALKVLNIVPMNIADVNHGTIRRESMTMTADQWTQLLSLYGIEVPQVMSEGYKVLPKLDHDRYPNRESQGLEGPFMTLSGKVLYYDPKEGKYYDSDSDFYLTYDEYQAYNSPRVTEGAEDKSPKDVDLVAVLKKALEAKSGWEDILKEIPDELRREAVSKLDHVWSQYSDREDLSGAKKGRLYRKLYVMDKQLRKG